ncbi:MAG: Eco57I restriction-modification methylase domain-containing protein [Lacunisphaera sp.]|nr:Eco57I restriction-modification methylase domain-containing protein [Lacunisphaera sp.]
MASNPELLRQIETRLTAFGTSPLLDASLSLFATLGYKSERRMKLRSSTAEGFLGTFDRAQLLNRDRALLADWQSVEFLFQLTDAEVQSAASGTDELAFDSKGKFDGAEINSFLFLAIELRPAATREGERKGQPYTRTELAGVTRALNRLFDMPALLVFKHGDTVSLGIIHRRLSKRDTSKDVLEKVTLIKDIAFADPIRAHVEILHDFALPQLVADYAVANFVALHAAWQKRLGSYALSNDFYREIADWYFWAHHQVADGAIRLPRHCDTEQEKSLFLIRLLTRVIFSWFLVEKRLIPAELFRENRLTKLIKDFTHSRDPKKPDTSPAYYRAVLQNLFFGTLNMPADQRGFREKARKSGEYDKNYGVTNLWRYETAFRDPVAWLKLAGRVPFLNGGLFDCLDDKSGKKKDNSILDGFSDREDFGCHLPNDLFFGPERNVDLSRDYGEEDKRTARSKKAKVRGLIEILSRYKFTIEENTPLEEEIALDPELLGKVFENLLASYNEDTRTTARKALGAFYTPREIVSYMVDEALKSYLSTQVPRCKAALDDLFSNKATLRDIKPDTRDALIAAIGRVKILDPACGSGAFPMGALHRLVDLLQKLDSNNESWKRDRLAEARRYRSILESSNNAKEELAACDARIADIEKSFDTRYHALDFARKLYLIENSIYGVDIQPIATQIAKLRFFISLVVDQKVEPAAPNLGVRPLPNLETRLVAADTLVPIEKADDHQFDLLDQEIRPLRRELENVRHAHFNARSPQAKRKCREQDAELREKIADLLKQSGMPAKSAAKLADCDLYDQNKSQPFFDCEWMFGLPVGKVRLQGPASATLLGNLSLINDAGGQTELTPSAAREIDSGFDVVIGNPPYIRIQTLKQKDPKIVGFYQDNYASAAKGNYDIYVVFIEAGLRLLKSDGHLAYICPHKFFNAQYGEPIREFIANGKHLRHVVHFGEQQVFPGASIYTCLLFLANAGAADCRFVRAADLEAWKATLAGTDGRFAATTIGKDEWNFTVGKGRAVFERLQAHSRTLESVTLRIFQGIKTSADKIYIVEERHRTKSKVCIYSPETEREHEVEPDLFHPLIKGGDSRAYILTKTDRLILFPYAADENGETSLIPAVTLKKNYPLTWAYLTANRKYLEAREDGAFIGPNWYVYGRSQALDVMSQPKLFTPDLALNASFAFDDTGELFFTGGVAGGYGILPKEGINPKWLLSLLNSRVVDFFHHQIATQMRGGWYSYESRFISNLPIAEASESEVPRMVAVVETLRFVSRYLADHPETASARDPLMVAYCEQILNGLVYELYFREELHAAGLRLFDLVTQANLPDITKVPEKDRLSTLRKKFEELYDIEHPLRKALFSLGDLEVVRIIEGKTA